MGLANMALIKNMNLERAIIIINMDTMTQENMILVNTDMEGQVKRLNTTGENGRIGTTVWPVVQEQEVETESALEVTIRTEQALNVEEVTVMR